MRLRILIILLSSISLIALMVPTLLPQKPVEASPLLQSLPSLQGVNIYFTEANEEASRFNQQETGLSRFAGLLRRQGANLYTLEWRTRFPADADLIVVAGPLTDFTPDQTARLWAYMNNGGKLLLLTNPVVETTRGAAWLSTGGLFSLMWSDFNTRARNDVVLTETLDTPQAESTEEPESDPGTPVTTFAAANLNAAHPITAPLAEPLMFFTPRSIEFDASPRDYSITPLVTTDSNFYGENQFADYLATQTIEYNIGAEAAGGDTPRGQLTLAVVIENPNNGMRVVLIGDREVATNGAGFNTSPAGSASFLHPDNVRFMMNAVAWLVDAEIVDYTFPTPGPSATASITPSPTATPSPTPEVSPTPTAEA